MIVQNLTLKNFRSYEYLSTSFDSKLNIIIGDNAEGKTNIVEAIHYLSLARSFRTAEDTNLIKQGNEFSTIEAEIIQGEIKKKINVTLTKDGKKITVNKKPISKLSELNDVVNVIVFEPKDVQLFKDSPRLRRQYLDVNLSKKSVIYFENISKYEKVLKERNELLKQNNPNKDQLAIITNMLIESALPVIKYRIMYAREINGILSKIVKAIKGEEEVAQIIYSPFIPLDEDYQTNAKNAYNKALESDLRKKATSIGPHREDFQMTLNGRDVSVIGSQGENRLLVLSLKLAPYFLIEDKDKRPIVVLDDVMSELDKEHQNRLISFLSKFEQVFLTATKLSVNNASTYEVKDHKITRRNS